jgi:hypothetical protein
MLKDDLQVHLLEILHTLNKEFFMSFILEAASKNGKRENISLEYSYDGVATIKATSQLLGEFVATGDDLFEALLSVRLALEKNGYLLLCCGSRIDAFPSRMTRQMAGGRKLYLHREGMPTKKDDLRDLFDSAGLETIGTVVQQRAAYENWLKSL